MPSPVRDHYQRQLNAETILTRLRQHYPEGPRTHQLAPIDQLHIGGLSASQQLVNRLGELGVRRVLDIGSGLGGLMRLVQQDTEIEIVGIDLCEEFNQLNRELCALCPGLSAPLLVTADAQQLPFNDGSFDLILFQHSLLNIPDAEAVLAECHRLLRPGGYLLLHEVIRGPNPGEMTYPVPWAHDAGTSHLSDATELQQRIATGGFRVQMINDWSEQALEWRRRQVDKEQTEPTRPAAVSPVMILGDSFHQMGRNILTNLESGAVRVIELLAQRS